MNKSLKLNLGVCCLGVMLGYATRAQVIKVGNIQSVTIEGAMVRIKSENAQTEIMVYSPNIIRVRTDKTFKTDFSYAVIAKPMPTKVKISQTDTEIVILTDSLKAIINKIPFSVAFYTLDDKIINQDEKGLTTSFVDHEVTTYKTMQNGERFIGLGEKTGDLDRKGNGYTNWNSDVWGYSTGQDPLYSTIPFYIGIHHQINYRIFLDNTYQSDFNFGASNNRFSSFGCRAER